MRGCNISIQFDTLPNTINLLGNELGHVIKQQAGIKYYKIVEEIRQKSKKYRSTQNEKYLNDIFNLLKNLKQEDLRYNQVIHNIFLSVKYSRTGFS